MVYTANPLSSSPRVRDKQFRVVHVRVGPGIIPAGAGQTSGIGANPADWRDHPRGCGANDDGGPQLDMRTGSSPRVRGKRQKLWGQFTSSRIIPAGAGQTPNTRHTSRSRSDHPRGCGANMSMTEGEERYVGSSPRVRGKLEGELSNSNREFFYLRRTLRLGSQQHGRHRPQYTVGRTQMGHGISIEYREGSSRILDVRTQCRGHRHFQMCDVPRHC